MKETLLPDERTWIEKVSSNLLDDDAKLVYADWLEERGDARGEFLRKYVQAARSLKPSEFPSTKGLPEEWLELIGFRLVERIAKAGFAELKEPALRLARPALRMKKKKASDNKIPVGASKIGGLPDLPSDFPWPPGGDCHAIYNDDTGGTERLAGFLAQVSLAEIANTQAASILPKTGVLSFFCFQDMENDNPDAVGVMAAYFPDAAKLVRTEPPDELTEGNETMPSQRLTFEETLDLPEQTFDGPWTDELRPIKGKDYDEVLDHFRSLNFENMLGYGRATSGGDPTPNKESRHLILLTNAAECRLHIQIPQKELAAHNFGPITLAWVDFD
jgi:uncharacterized protein (TIGR02996 family)